MSKLVLPLLTIAAFLYAVWLLVFRRRLPDPERVKGMRRRFYLAVVVFAGLLSGTVWLAQGKPEQPRVLCYVTFRPPAWAKAEDRQAFAAALRGSWDVIDAKRFEGLREATEHAAKRGLIRRRVAGILRNTYENLLLTSAYREEEKRVVCYDSSGPAGMDMQTADAVSKQLDALRRFREAGTIDEETATKVHAALAADLEALDRIVTAARGADGVTFQSLRRAHAGGKISGGDAAAVAADLIMEMQGVTLPDLAPTQRLAVMKNRVMELLLRGPEGNDWIDPGVSPNVREVLRSAGLVDQRSMVKCYDRGAAPVQGRSDELKRLQQELLDKSVKAGVLDVEVAEKAAAATTRESEPDYATEEDIRSYQQNVRRAVRMLYKRGELPSSYVREMERAADTEIIRFAGGKELPRDVRYHLRSVLWDPLGREVLKALETRKLVPATRNHRLVMQYFGPAPKVSEHQQAQLDEFIALIDGEEDFALPGDENQSLSWRALRPYQREYPMKVRRVCRALIKTGLCDPGRLKPVEQAIGLPIVSRLEN